MIKNFEGDNIADIIAQIEARGQVFTFTAFKRVDGTWRVTAEWFKVPSTA